MSSLSSQLAARIIKAADEPVPSYDDLVRRSVVIDRRFANERAKILEAIVERPGDARVLTIGFAHMLSRMEDALDCGRLLVQLPPRQTPG